MPDAPPAVVIVQPAKPWWRSRTLWINAIVLMLAVAEAKLGYLQAWLPVNVYGLIAFVLPVLNAGLRVVTTGTVTLGSSTTVVKAGKP